MSEIEKLLNELRNMQSDARASVLNNKETWSKISQRDIEGAGFESEEELKTWLENNPYSAIA